MAPIIPTPALTVPGVGWVLAFTIAAEIGTSVSPARLTGYTAFAPGGAVGRVGPARAALQAGAALPALGAARGDHARAPPPGLLERYQRNKRRLGKQRGAKVAQIDIARKLTVAIWHMLTRNESFAPRGAALRLAA